MDHSDADSFRLPVSPSALQKNSRPLRMEDMSASRFGVLVWLGCETPPPLLSFDDFLQKRFAVEGCEGFGFFASADVAGGDLELFVDADDDPTAA